MKVKHCANAQRMEVWVGGKRLKVINIGTLHLLLAPNINQDKALEATIVDELKNLHISLLFSNSYSKLAFKCKSLPP